MEVIKSDGNLELSLLSTLVEFVLNAVCETLNTRHKEDEKDGKSGLS